jgi:pimeloyl-ACP methyl ester carboxylesterase
MSPDTIVLIHGFWVTPRSWEEWISYYQDKGYRVLAPAYPGFEVEVEALNADPTPIENLTVPAVIDHLTEVIGALERPPILMGHSAGGVFTQLMLDRGYGAVGVVMDSAPTEGVPVVPLSQLKSTFCNTFPEERSRQLYERYHIPASVRVLWGSALATLEPGHQDTFVNYDNDDRAPLLFISGTHDHLMPPSVQRSNAKHYKSKTVTEVVEFDGPHLLPSRDGWEEVADYALAWAVAHAK